MDNKKFIEDYKQAFGEKAVLPIAFWYSDTPVAESQPVNGCFFPAFEKVREGQAVSFDNTTMKCGGGKFYCGLAPMPEYVPTFVSEKEHYKASPAFDIMHFGWNIGKAFGKPRLQTATFIKRIFAHTLRDSEISTIERKMSHTESVCKIKLDRKIA